MFSFPVCMTRFRAVMFPYYIAFGCGITILIARDDNVTTYIVDIFD